jgi:plasmid stabilization system protein ParE
VSNAPVVVEFHRLAAEEYRRARNWYARGGQGLAERFRDAVDQVVQRIATTPHQGALYQGRYCWFRTRRFPYVLYYDIVDPNRVMILAVAHARRRPGYWRRRSP